MLLKLTNVGVLGPGTIELDLVQGVNAIIGENGKGKSTIVNALYFAITGETIDGSLNEDMITWGCSQMSIFLKYKDITITRSLNIKGTSKATFIRGSSEPLTRKKEITAAICEFFGIFSISVFKMVYIAEQFKSNDIIQTSDANRLDMLSDIFGLSALESIRDFLLDASNSIDIYEIPVDMQKLAENTLNDAKNDLNKWILEQNRLNSLVLTPERRKELEEIINAPECGTREKQEIELKKSEKDLEAFQKEEESLPKPPTVEEANIYKKAMSNVSFENQRKDLANQIAALGATPPFNAAALRSFIEDINSKLVSANAERKILMERPLLIKEGKCPITKGPPCPDLEALTNRETITADLANIDAHIAKLTADKEEISKMLEVITEYDNQYKYLKHLLDKIPANYDVGDFDVSAYEKRMHETQEVSDRRAMLNMFIGERLAYIAELKSKLKESENLTERSTEEKSIASAAFNFGIEAATQLQTVNQAISAAEKRVMDSTETLNLYAIQNKTAEINKDKKYVLDKVRFALHRDNVPRMLIEKFLDRLNRIMESYLTKFNFPYTVKFSTAGKILYFTSDGEAHEAKKLSGGQQYVVVIAFRCALSDILNTQFPLFVFDEPTTGLDIQNRDALSDVLIALGQIRNKIVIIPTHDEKLLPESKIFSV